MPRYLWGLAVSIALAIPAPFASATVTFVRTFGDGSERCLIGNASGRCTKGGTFRGAYSITELFSAWTGRSLVRVDDDQDKVWSAGSFGYLEVMEVAHYLDANSKKSFGGIWVDDGKFSKSELTPFPAGTELSASGDRTLGVVLPGERVTADIVTGHVFESSFIAMTLDAAAFEFVFRSKSRGEPADYYSSDNTSRGFDNRVVSGKTFDHMVTWYAGTRVDSRDNIADVYLIAFERMHKHGDFQDAVYAVSIPVARITPVPEPPIWMLLAMGFGLTAWVRFRGAQ